MERLARLVIRHRLIVSLVWLALFVGGIVAAGQLSSRLSVDFSLPGQPGDTAEKALIGTYGVSSFDTYVAVLTLPAGQQVSDNAAKVGAVFAATASSAPGVRTRLVDQATTGDPAFTTQDGRTAYALIQGPLPTSFGPGLNTILESALAKQAQAAGYTSGMTSYAMLSAGDSSDAGPSVLAETLLGASGALVVLLFVFASLLAFMPLVIAAVSILTTFLLVFVLTTFSDVSFVVQFLIALIGLGVAIDYSLLIITRWREERAHGHDNEEAVVIAMRTAGHAVLASGVTVAISLVALVVVPVPFLRSMGIGGMLIPLVSVAVVLTLLPALLSKVGPRVDWPRIRHEDNASRVWTAWSRLIVRRRWIAAGVAVLILAVLIAPVFSLKIGTSGVASLAKSGPAYDTLKRLEAAGVGDGVLTPIEVLVPKSQATAAATAARGVDGVQLSVVGADSGAIAVVDVVPKGETVDSTSNKVVDDVRTAVQGAVDGNVGVTGPGAAVGDYFSAVYDRFPYVLGLIALITFLLLMRTFRSVVLPIKAVALNLVSLAAVFGAVVWFWQLGHGSDLVFNTSGTGAITFWLPVLIFAFLFGLSMDYEVFILSRMREEYDATGDTGGAVTVGLGRTGRLVTSAALILFFAFAALASAPGTDIKLLGSALGVGILIDATVIRALLVPALVSLLGGWNWWLPTWLARILRVEPSPLIHEPRRPVAEPLPVAD